MLSALCFSSSYRTFEDTNTGDMVTVNRLGSDLFASRYDSVKEDVGNLMYVRKFSENDMNEGNWSIAFGKIYDGKYINMTNGFFRHGSVSEDCVIEWTPTSKYPKVDFWLPTVYSSYPPTPPYFYYDTKS